MADKIAAIATENGAKVERTADGRRILLRIETPRGVCVYLDFDGKSCQPDVHVIAWNLAYWAKGRLRPSVFDCAVNPHHGAKATLVRYGFAALAENVSKVLAADAAGEALDA